MMYIISIIRYNDSTDDKELYYYVVENYRGKSNLEIMLKIGFLEDKLNHFQIDKISEALNSRWRKYEGYTGPFLDESTLRPKILEYLDKFWKLLTESGKLAEVHKKKEKTLEGQKCCILSSTMKERNLGKIGVAWFIFQFLRKIEFRKFLRTQGFSEAEIFASCLCLIDFLGTPSNPKNDYDFDYSKFINESSLLYFVEAFACEECFIDEMPTYGEIITIPEKLLSIQPQLEKFLLSVAEKLYSSHQGDLASPTPCIVDFESYKSNINLNQTGRHRAVFLDSFMKELYDGTSNEMKNKDWLTANLFVGWISYVISSIIKNVLKKAGIEHSWNNVIFNFENQHLVLTTGKNYKGIETSFCTCTYPSPNAQKIYEAFGFELCPTFPLYNQNNLS